MHVIDDALIKYPGLAVLISGVIVSVWTPWGLVKYYWVVMKLVLTVALILIGILFVGDWFSFVVRTVDHYGAASLLQNQDFQAMRLSLILIAVLSITAMALMTFITHYKPFGKIKR